MNGLAFSAGTPSMMVLLDSESSGDMTDKTTILTREVNVAAAEGFANMLLEVVPADQIVPLLQIRFGEMMDKVIAYANEVAA